MCLHGPIFTIGTSFTSGAHDQCTWASVHHETCWSGGVANHGYPDPGYFVNCNQELNSLGVPAAEVIDTNGIVMKFFMLQVKATSLDNQPPILANPTEQQFKSLSCVTHGDKLQRALTSKPSKIQVKAPASISQPAPIDTTGIVTNMKPSIYQVKAAASHNQQPLLVTLLSNGLRACVVLVMTTTSSEPQCQNPQNYK